jgi:hypothetical protein
MIYRVQQLFPIPFRCRKCWRLGHPTSRCSQASVCCKIAVNPTIRNLSAPRNVSTATALPMTLTATPARSL